MSEKSMIFSTPRRTRRSSVGSLKSCISPNSSSNSTTMTTHQRASSTGRRRSSSLNRHPNPVSDPDSENHKKKELELSLNPSTILHLLNKITKSTSSSLTGLKLSDLIENPKRCRNLMIQFIGEPSNQYSFPIDKDETFGRLFASSSDDFLQDLNKNWDSNVGAGAGDDDTNYRAGLLKKLDASADTWCEKYRDAVKAGFVAKQSTILKPELIESVTHKLEDFNQAIRLISFCPIGKEVDAHLFETKKQPGIPCLAEVHEHLVTSIESLDKIIGVVVDDGSKELTESAEPYLLSLPNEAFLNQMLVKETYELENKLKEFDYEYDEYFRLVEENEKLYEQLKRLKSLKTEMETTGNNKSTKLRVQCIKNIYLLKHPSYLKLYR